MSDTPKCDMCQREITTGMMAMLCKNGSKCELWPKDEPGGGSELFAYRMWEDFAKAHVAKIETGLADARAALNDYVWRDREQFPNDPYCAICGAGKAWAEKHGHETTCVLAKQG